MTSIFRIVQEALANITRHARAKHVELDMGIDEMSKEFVLIISDDGQGFDSAKSSNGMGIGNMRSRAAEIGGYVSIESQPGFGTKITLRQTLLDPKTEAVARHQKGLVALLILFVTTFVLRLLFKELGSYFLPLLIPISVLAVFHGWKLARLHGSRN